MKLQDNLIYVLSDNHINRSKFDSEKWEFTRKNLNEAFSLIVEDFKKKENKKKNKFLLFWWDLFDKFESTTDFKKWEYWFVDSLKKYFLEEDIKILMITWNHDCNNVSDFTAISWFNKYSSWFWENLICIENDFSVLETENINFFLCPFPFLHKNRKNWFYLKKIKSKLNEYEWNEKKNILLSHFIVDWIQSSAHGWLSYRNVHSTENELKKLWFDLILLWDNHVHYVHDNIISIWSSEQVSFSEENFDKFILKIEFDKNWEFIFNNELELEEASKKKLTVTIDTKDFNQDEFEEKTKEKVEEYENEIEKRKIKLDIRVNIIIRSEFQDKIYFIRSLLWKIKEESISYVENYNILQWRSDQDLDDLEVKDLMNEDNLIKNTLKQKFWFEDEQYFNMILDKKDLISWWKKDLIIESIFSKLNKL